MASLTSNLDRWRFYLKDITSPDIYIEWGAYSIISAALQRRVWRGSERKPLFPNTYVVLCGDPGIGKGLVIQEVSKVLRYHKLHRASPDEIKEDTHPRRKTPESPLLIPVGPDASTYEALVRILSRANRIHFYTDHNAKMPDGSLVSRPYRHSSISMCLEEISSLFRQHTEDLVNFLITAYDCGDYKYETISRGEDFIHSCCLNIIGGTTPGFMRRVFSDALLTEGFASRSFFVYAASNRFERLSPPEFSEEQIEEYKLFLAHIKKLAELFGEVKFTEEAINYGEEWIQTAKINKANNDPRLIPYYSRIGAHVQKLAMIVHFMDSTEMTVGLEPLLEAIKITNKTERLMHKAIAIQNKNPLAEVSSDMVKFLLSNGPTKSQLLLIEFWDRLPDGEDSFRKIMNFLLVGKQVELDSNGKYKAKKEAQSN